MRLFPTASYFLFVTFFLNQCSDKHNNGEDNQIPDIVHSVLVDRCVDNNTYACKRKQRKNKSLEYTLVFFFKHPCYKHRNVERIDCNYGEFGRIEVEKSEPAFCKVCTIEIYKPE